jgi:ribonuclease Z
MSTVFISHGHMDHVGGLGYWASQRFLNAMGPGTVLAPSAIADQVGELMQLMARLEGGRPYEVSVVPVSKGSVHELRADLELRFFDADHWVPTLGSELWWCRKRLRTDLVGTPPSEVARLRRAGERVTVSERTSLLAFCADTGPRLFAWHPEVLASEVLLIECSFFRPTDRERASRYGHLHLDDLLAQAPRFGCRHLILLHASKRQRLREVETILDDTLRPQLDCSLHHLVVDWP